MINISKSGNAIKFAFTDSDHYLYGNGEIEVPVNSLSLIVDESNMVTFRKANSNDIFLSFDPANSNLSDKEGVIDFYKSNMVGSTGGGGSESGITSGEVQTMIDNSLEDYYTDDEVDAALSGKASASDVAALQNEVAAKADTSAVTAVASDVQTVSGQVATKVDTTDFSTYSAATDARIAEDEEVTAAALNDLDENKQGKLAYYEENTEDGYADIYMTNDDGQGNVDEYAFNVGGGSVDFGHYNQYDDGQGNSGFTSTSIMLNNPEINIYAESEDNGETEATYFDITPLGVTINYENVATEPYVDAAVSGKADTSAVTAVNNALTAHTSDTDIHVTTAQTAAWNAKAEPYSAGTGIEISGNVISATGGGGVLVINIDDLTNNMSDAKWDELANALENDIPIFSVIDASGEDTTDIQQFPVNGMLIIDENEGTSEITLNHLFGGGYYEIHIQKNGSEDYTITTDWHFVPNELSAGTGIDITDNVISCTVSGGGATYSAGTNISIDTANTINCTLPISVTGRYLGKSLILTSGNGMAAEGACSIIAGNQVNANQNASYGCAVGSWLNIKNESESSFGVGNNSVTGSTTSGQTLFSVGNGTSSARHNAFEIRKNGDIYVNDGTNDVRLQDTILALGGLKLVQCTQAEYDALVSGGTVDSSTIYFITNVVS